MSSSFGTGVAGLEVLPKTFKTAPRRPSKPSNGVALAMTQRHDTKVVKPKRLSINMPPDLHRRFKIACTRANLVMVNEVLAFIERRTTELERS
jgi:hypothetical protein